MILIDLREKLVELRLRYCQTSLLERSPQFAFVESAVMISVDGLE